MGPAGRPRDLALALIISRVVAPASKPSTAGLVGRHHTEPDLGVAGASTDDVYAAMDWLAGRQDAIEAGLAAWHRHHRDAHRADQHPARRLRPHRHPDPADPEVARTPPGQPDRNPRQTLNHRPN
jgi:hypothetical protein